MGQSASSDAGGWGVRRAVVTTLFVAGVAAAAWLLVTFRGVVALLLLAIVLSTAIWPAVGWLHRRGIPRAVGVVLVYIAVLLVLAAFVVAVVPPLVAQVGAIVVGLPGYYQDLRQALLDLPSPLMQGLGGLLPAEIVLPMIEAPAGQTVGAVIVQSLAYANAVVSGLLSAAAVFLLGYYWTLHSRVIIAQLLRWVPGDRRDTVEGVISEIEAKLGHYVVAELLLGFVVGSLALIVYLVIGLPYPVVLAVIAGVMEVVPIIGPWVAGLAAVLVALSFDPGRAIWTAVAAAGIQFLEGNLLVPRLMKRVVGTHPLVTLLSLATFASVFGFAGILLAVPIAAAIQIALNRLVLSEYLAEVPPPEGRDQLAALRYQVRELARDVQRQFATRDTTAGAEVEAVEDEIEAIAADLDRLLERAQAERSGKA